VNVEMNEDKIQSPEEARAIIMEKLREGYGRNVSVDFLRSELETDLSDGRRFWVVEGRVHIRRWFFIRKSWHFTYFVDARDGRILIMRVKKA
jgi:hypothetical protein